MTIEVGTYVRVGPGEGTPVWIGKCGWVEEIGPRGYENFRTHPHLVVRLRFLPNTAPSNVAHFRVKDLEIVE